MIIRIIIQKGSLGIICLLALLISSCTGNRGIFISSTVKTAEKALASGNYKEAAGLYSDHLKENPQNHRARSRYGIALFQLTDLEGALEQLNYSVNRSKKPNADAFYYLALAFHYKQDFRQAADHYKNFLRKSKKDDPRNAEVMAQISRCHQGIQQNYIRPVAIVANLGTLVNSSKDEIIPYFSPSNSEKVYFSSNRNQQDLSPFQIEGRFNMFQSDFSNGLWQKPYTFLSKYQSDLHDILQAIDPDGRVLLFTQGEDIHKGKLYVDSFGVKRQEPTPFETSIQTELGDKDLYIVNDSVILFSSRRNGGFGGFDLYYTLYANNKWLQPINLGPEINSVFDEVAPFLSKDGRTLYFSSNRRESMGSLDIFKSFFSDETNKWTTTENLGLPINSALDDMYIKLSDDGKRLLFSSNRIAGQGGYDIYIGTMRAEASEQLLSLAPFYLFDEKAIMLTAQTFEKERVLENSDNTASPVFRPLGVKNIKIEQLFFREADTGLSEQNKEKLDMLVQHMKSHPEILLELRSHLPSDGNRTFQMYSSIEQATKVFQYLVSKGILPGRIITKGLGDQYPIAKETVDGKANPSAAFLNRRIETIFHKVSNDIVVEQVFPEISPFLQSDKYEQYAIRVKGLTYKIQFVSLRQMFSGDLMDNLPDATIERIGDSEIMQYSVGLHKTLSEALEMREEVVNRGFKDAFLVVYINGLKISRSNITEALTDRYPDLLNYLKYTE